MATDKADRASGGDRKRPKRDRSDAQLLLTAKKILSVYRRIAPGVPKAIDAKAFARSVATLESSVVAVAAANNARARAVAVKKRSRRALDQYVKRIRSGIKGHYGDDSEEYELVGGTPLSKRKKRPRRK